MDEDLHEKLFVMGWRDTAQSREDRRDWGVQNWNRAKWNKNRHMDRQAETLSQHVGGFCRWAGDRIKNKNKKKKATRERMCPTMHGLLQKGPY